MGTLLDFDLPDRGAIIAAIGVFDGVHLGHRKILDAACRMAAAKKALPAAFTFNPHPREILCPGNPPQLLMPLAERIRQLDRHGAQKVGVIRFSAETAAWEPEYFLDELCAACDNRIGGICVGEHWRFGARGSGDRERLGAYCQKHGISFSATPERTLDDKVISSTSIREAVASGALDAARAMLGRPPSLFGRVVCGFGAAGKILSAPTANLECSAGILAPDGVYAGRAATENGKIFLAAVNIGLAPTFNVGIRRVEIHLLDFQGDLYDQELRLDLLRYLRPERRFDSPAELRNQIAADIASIRQAE